MIKRTFISAALATVLTGLAAQAADEPTLRAVIAVDGPLVTLGDLVEGAGEAADTAVFRAPDPGTSGMVGVGRIIAAAAEHGITGLSRGGIDAVSVTRSSRAIEPGEIERRIAEQLVDEAIVDAPANARVTLDASDTMHIEAAAVAPVSVKRFEYDPRTGRFAAVIAIADSALAGAGFRVSGRAVEVVDVPVLVNPVRRGETISAVDVALERMALTEIREDAILSADGLVGRAARRSLRPGSPVDEDSVMAPILVSRNDAVTIVYRIPGLTLTARGRAIGAGAHGDVVTVLNTQSKRTVDAQVTGRGEVAILPPQGPLAALAVEQ